MKTRNHWKRAAAFLTTCAMIGTSMPVGYLNVTAADPDKTKLTYEQIKPYYNVDCGDFDVTTPPENEDFGQYQSVTEQVLGKDAKTGKTWGIKDDYEVTPPSANLTESSGQGVRTNWTWSQENGGFSTDSPKTATNRYTKNQWEQSKIFGNTRKLDYSFELPAGTYDVELACVDPWNCSTNPAIYLNEGKDSQINIGTYKAGNVVNKEITLAEGENLTVDFRGTDSNTKAINVSYIMISNPEYKNLYKSYTNASLDEKATGNFDLPQGTDGTTISWSSSNDKVIHVNGTTAEVTRGSKEQKVTLMAEISDSEYYVTKEIEVTVPALAVVQSNVAVESFENEDVTVTDSYYTNAYDKEVEYLVSLDTDRLLAGFRETAAYAAGYDADQRTAFMKNKTRYDGWENTLIGGHTIGHYMSAIAQAYANPEASEQQKADLLAKINACAEGLKECQELTKGSTKCKEGYLFGATIPNTNVLESQFNKYDGQGTSSSDWVAWYTMHKVLAGLVDLYKYAGSETALDTAVNLGLWTYNRASKWDVATKQKVLNVEYGGMNDALYELYACIKDNAVYSQNGDKILKAAEQFDEISLFEKVKNGGTNVLNNRHANTTIPKFIGALKRYLVLGEDESQYLEYAEKFWDMVTTHHTYITGGNSENEHFGADDILYGERTTVNCETCNTYNMLKLTRDLYRITGDKKYSDYYENTLINAIMSSQNPETGMSMYFQPMATGYQKVFGKPTTDFWCCTGSGMENFVKLNDSIYFHMDDSMIVNQYLSSNVTWEDKNVKLTQTSGIQRIESEESVIKVEAIDDTKESNIKLALRIPNWVADQGNTMKVWVNGSLVEALEYFDYEGKEAYADAAGQQRYYVLDVKGGDTVKVQTPMETVAYNLPDGEGVNTYAFKYGPVVLSAKLGNDPSKQTEVRHGVAVRKPSTSAVTSDRIGIYSTESVEEYMQNINENMVRTTGNVFRLKGANCTYDFVPHYSQYTDNYGIYWTYYAGSKDSVSIINEKDTNRKNRIVIDSVQAGYGQYEQGLDTSTGNVGSSTEHTRYATAGGYFEYEIKVDAAEKNYFLVTLRREDDGKPLTITSGETTLFESKALDGNSDQAIQGLLSDSDFEKYYQIKVEIPEAVLKTRTKDSEGNEVVRIRFAGTAELDSARLYNWSYCVRGYEESNELTALEVEGQKVELKKDKYVLNLGKDQTSFKVKAQIADSKGYVAVNGQAIEEDQDAEIELTGYSGEYKVEVYAENFEVVDSYTIQVKTDTSNVDFSGNIKKYYSFDEKLDDAKTVQKATVPSEISKTPVYTEGAAENTGKALKMDGSYGLLLGDAKELGESYTVSYWMKPDKIGGTADPTFCAGVFDPEYWLSATFNARIWSKNGSYISTTAADAYRSNEWQYVSIVVDGEEAGSQDGRVTGKLYVNGELVSSGDVAKGIMTNDGAKLYFGVNKWDAYYQGAIDELMVLDTALNKREINAFMNGTIGSDGKIAETPDVPDQDEDQLIASFNFDDEATGLTGAGAKATVKGNVSYADHENNGKALYLDGNGGYLDVTKESGESLLTGLKEMTISYDAKADRTATNWMFYAAPNTNAQTYRSEQYFGILTNNGTTTAERYKNSGSRPSNPSATTGSDWVHVDVVADETTTKVYVNGVQQSSVDSSIALSDIFGDQSILHIGKANWGGGEYAKAYIDNLEIRSRAMTEAEIAKKQGIEISALKGVSSADLSVITSETQDKTITLYASRTNSKAEDLTKAALDFELADGATVEDAKETYDVTKPVTVSVNYKNQKQEWTINVVLCNSPVLPGEFADPDIDVFNGKFYIYPTTDGISGWGGYQFHAFSSTDLVNWEDEGIILDLKVTESYENEKGVEVATVPWASGNAWAPTIEKKNGRYYFYFCGNNGNAKAIGVAVADSPAGPYTVKETPLLTIEECKAAGISMGQVIDPSIFTEDDGTSYMLFGNGNPAIVQLSDDMMSWVPGTLKNYSGATGFREAITVTKRDGKYHFTWSQDDTGSENYQVNYGVSDSLFGPISYKYPILQKDNSKNIKGTGHHSIVKVPGKDEYYIAYHRFLTPLGQVMSGFGYHRETCVDKLTFGEDGLIQKVTPTLEGNQTAVKLDTVQVTYTAGEHGTIQGDTKQTVNKGGESNRVTAVPDAGYVFEKWSDGVTDAVRYDKNVTEDASYTAIFKEEVQCTVTYEAGMGGTIEGEATQTVEKNGTTKEVTAAAKDGYVFVKWSDGVTTATRNNTNVTASMKVRAEFKAAEETVIADFNFDDGENGFKGNGAVAKVNGTGALTNSYPGGGKSVSLSSNNWLSVTKEDGSALLKGLEEITVSYDSRAVNYKEGWTFYAAPNTNQQVYNSEHYVGILDKGTGIQAERYNNSGARPGKLSADSTVEWKHVDLVIEKDKTTLYVDGEKKSEMASTYKLSDILGADGGIVQIGKANWGSGEYSNGQIDNLKIYSVARTPEELKVSTEDKDVVARAKAGLEIPGMDDIRGNITLTDSLYDAEITWKSSNTNVITDTKVGDKEAGVVTRGDKDQKVTLTATIKKGDVTDKKEFEVTVTKAPKELKDEDFTAYLFGSFTGTEGSKTDEQIYFATSTDGYYYTDLNDKKPVLESTIGENGVRDPYILRSAEGDKFYMIATDLSIYYRGGWGKAAATTTGSRDLIIWESTDLVNWSEPRAVAVGPVDAGCAWAPEAIYNEKTGEYVVYYATAHVVDGKTDKALRIFVTTTRDFVNFTESQEYIYRSDSQSIIDTTMVYNAEDGYYYRASADGQITLERSKDIFGTWEKVTTLNDLSLGGNMTGQKLEGPELFKFNKKDWVDGKPTYGLYTDQYAEGKGYLPVITTDLSDATNANGSWKKLSSNEYSFDARKKRHGTILNLTQEEYERVMKAYGPEQDDTDAKKAAEVSSLIEAIGTVAYDEASKAKIDTARAAYDALTDTQKALVSNVKALTDAEARYAELKKEAETDKPEPTPPETETDKPAPKPNETEKPSETEKPQTPSNELKKGDVVVGEGAYGVYEYRITGKNTAEIIKVTAKGKKKATLKIFKTAKLGGKKYKITSVAANALKGNKKVKTLTIETNTVKIGKNAFANCKNLKKIVIKSKKLKTVGSKAFKGISKKAIVKVPKSKKKSYTKLLQKRGLPKNVKIK